MAVCVPVVLPVSVAIDGGEAAGVDGTASVAAGAAAAEDGSLLPRPLVVSGWAAAVAGAAPAVSVLAAIVDSAAGACGPLGADVDASMPIGAVADAVGISALGVEPGVPAASVAAAVAVVACVESVAGVAVEAAGGVSGRGAAATDGGVPFASSTAVADWVGDPVGFRAAMKSCAV
jgi:hypothetical protein